MDLHSFEIRLEFKSDDYDLIPFKSDGLIFKSAASVVVPQTTLTVQQKMSTVAPL